jgi:hypothetical protein
MPTKIPPQLLMPEARFNPIRNGSRGIVFNILDEYAAKVLFTGDIENNIEDFTICMNQGALEKLTYEYEIASRLYYNGISVPEPVGIEELVLFFDEKYPAFIMQYLPFPSGAELTYPVSEYALTKAKLELGKAVDLDFSPGGDCLNPNNYMYDTKNEQVYLIDFERWEYEGGEDK